MNSERLPHRGGKMDIPIGKRDSNAGFLTPAGQPRSAFRIHHSSFILGLVLFLISTLCGAKPFENAQCQECHGVKGFSVPTGEHGETPHESLFIATESFEESVHGALACTDCHDDIEELPHRKGRFGLVDCVTCHEQIRDDRWAPADRAAWLRPQLPDVVTFTRDYVLSAHADTSVPNNAGCATCHTAHYVFPSDDPRASTHRLESPEMCGACHQKSLERYWVSLHGAALKRPWGSDSATCSDCHSSHKVTDLTQLPAHRLVTERCGDCHAAERDGYMASPHGQLAWHDNPDTPKCVDCHDSHGIVPVAHPTSPVNTERQIETCRKCHEQANAQFVKYQPHGTTRNFDKYPGLWLLGKGMGALIVLVLAFSYIHSALWWWREWREERQRPVVYRRVGGLGYPMRVKHVRSRSGVHFRRLAWGWRVNHWLLALSLMLLVFTGMVVMYPNTDWAQTLVPLLGGIVPLNTIHHWAGVVFLLTIFGHSAVVLARILRDRDFEWFGPDSLLPRRQDWEDIKGQFRWYFGKGEQPRFGRWTYWEKFEYWAVYWGALVIGLSGLLLWFAEAVGTVLPGWVFNLAVVAHGLEAFLAVMTLFVVHFFNNHFRPAKFPLDPVMFTGSWELEEFKEERPAEYERLRAFGKLDGFLVAPPSKTWYQVSHLLGFTLLGVGLLLLALVVDGFLRQGLF